MKSSPFTVFLLEGLKHVLLYFLLDEPLVLGKNMFLYHNTVFLYEKGKSSCICV